MKDSKLVFTISFFLALLIFPANLITTNSPAQAATNANLFVSAENSKWNNYFAGPQVIQVIVADPDINRLDQQYGEPVVTINGKRLRMAQGTDGNWYAYFADRNQAIAASNKAAVSGKGLNFGGFCSPTSTFSPKGGVTYTDTKGFAIARGSYQSINRTNGIITSGGLPDCTNNINSPLTASQMEHVVRQNKTLNTDTSGFAATQQYVNTWPIIQLYDFAAIPTTVTIDYQKSGGDQIVNLTFDRIPQNYISATVDAQQYSQNSPVFVQINDPQLNIDPTDIDSWTWGSDKNVASLYYQAFDRNGQPDAILFPDAMQNLNGSLTTMMFNHNGKLLIDPRPTGIRTINFQSNGIQQITPSRGDPALVSLGNPYASQPITFVESGGINTGIFKNQDNQGISNIATMDNPSIGGKYATINYNAQTININTAYTPTISSRNEISFQSGVFTPPPGINIASIKNGHNPTDVIHFLLQFSKLPDSIDRDALATNGITLGDYVTGNTYIASTKAAYLDAILNVDKVQWADKFNSTYKISPHLANFVTGGITIVPAWAQKFNQVALTFILHRDGDVNEVKNVIQSQNGTLIASSSLPSVTASFNNATLGQVILNIASDDNVQWIDYIDPPLYPLVDQARLITQVSGPSSIVTQHLGLTGNGVKVQVYDGGCILNHDDLAGRLDSHCLTPTSGMNQPADWHATLVAGILGGSGRVDPTFVGIAPNVEMMSYDYLLNLYWNDNPSAMEGSLDDGIGNGANLATMSLGGNLLFSSASYMGYYTATSEMIDKKVHGSTTLPPLLFFEAVGNLQKRNPVPTFPGFYSIDIPAAAKNSIAVGAINTDNVLMTDFSSWGPTQDGRIKPDIVAPGSHHNDNVGIVSTCMMNNLFPYNACSNSPAGTTSTSGYSLTSAPTSSSWGTSFSTPVASGIAALMIEEWRNTHHYPDLPWPSTVKDILIHTATMPSGIKTPNYQYGWGAINASGAVKLISDDVSNNFIHAGSIRDMNTVDEYTFQPIGTGCVKATLAWDDVPGAPGQSRELINDLDLRMKDNTGKLYYPFVLNSAVPSFTPILTGIDHTNNVEMVVGKVNGLMTIYVDGAGITTPPQDYTLIITEIPQNDLCNASNSHSNISSLHPAPNFSLSVSQSVINVPSGSSSNLPIHVTSVDGFTGDVNLNTISPSSITANFTPPPVHLTSGGSGSQILTIGAGTSVPSGIYPLTITGADAGGTITHTIRIALNVVPNSGPGPLDHFDVTDTSGSSIATQTSGTSFNIKIVARDAAGNTVTSFTSTATLSDSLTGISPTTSSSFVAGVLASQPVTLTNKGTDSITATSGASSGTSNSFNVSGSGPCTCPNACAFGEEQNHIEPTQQLQTLREFRDNSVDSTTMGVDFMKVFNVWYFGLGSPIAYYEQQNPTFREIAKITVYPVLYILEYSAKIYDAMPGEFGIATFGILSSLLIGAVYVSPFALLIKKVRKNKFNHKIAIVLISAISFSIVAAVLSSNHYAVMATTWFMVLTLVSISAILVAKSIYKIIQKFNMS